MVRNVHVGWGGMTCHGVRLDAQMGLCMSASPSPLAGGRAVGGYRSLQLLVELSNLIYGYPPWGRRLRRNFHQGLPPG